MATARKTPAPRKLTKPADTRTRLQRKRDALAEALASGEPVFPYPEELPEEHRKLWRDTVNTKTGSYWTKADTPLLLIYCRSVSDIIRLSAEIDDEGEMIYNAKNNPVVNPKIVIRGYAEARLMSLCTKLRLQPTARMDTNDEKNQLKQKRTATNAAKTMEDDDDSLLAGGINEGGDDDSHVH